MVSIVILEAEVKCTLGPNVGAQNRGLYLEVELDRKTSVASSLDK